MSIAIGVAIGLILMYLTLSLVVSAFNEAIAAVFARRGVFLKRGIENLLGKELAKKFYDHGMIKALSNQEARSEKRKLPSYVSASTFANVALSLVKGPPVKGPLDDWMDEVDEDAQNLKETLPILKDEIEEVEALKAKLETWFDETMDRVSGWYKRKTKILLFILGLGLCAVINADTVNVARVLWTDPAVRSAAEDLAKDTLEEVPAPTSSPGSEEEAPTEEDAVERVEDAVDAVGDLEKLQLPLGWVGDRPDDKPDPREAPGDLGGWLLKLLGILMTSIALTFGAPFWFDLLKRFVNVRSSGDPEEDEPKRNRGGSGATRATGASGATGPTGPTGATGGA